MSEILNLLVLWVHQVHSPEARELPQHATHLEVTMKEHLGLLHNRADIDITEQINIIMLYVMS